MKLKVKIVGSVEGRGGIETVLTHVLNSKIINDNLDTSLFLVRKTKYSDFYDSLNNNVIVNKTNYSNNVECLIRFVNFLINYDGDALIIMGSREVLIAHIIKKIFFKKYKVISWMHNSKADKSLKFKLLKYADANLAISNEIKDDIINEGVDAERIKVVYNPIKKKSKVIPPNEEKCTFIYVSRIILDGQKNFRGLLNSLKNLDGNWELNVYGAGEDFEKAEKIVSANKNLNSKVNFKGWVNDPWNEIKTANALILNSNYEGFGMVIAEAMSYGIPGVSSNCKAGPSDIIEQGENGYLYPVGDYLSLNKYLQKFIENKNKFEPSLIKKSINFLYDDEYDNRLVKDIKYFVEK